MPSATAVILAAIVIVFVLFGVVLAWGEYRTRNLVRGIGPGGGAKPPVAAQKKAGAERVREMV